MNAYFASIEQQANPFLRGRPIAVVRKPWAGTIVTAPSYEAKAYGVRTGMPTWEARRLCPEIAFVVEDLPKYAWVSSRIFSILRGFSPSLEVFSIDEAFLDITQISGEYGGPLEAARAIKREIKRRLGSCLRCSIGIAPSKVLAKIASESEKPDGLVWIRDEEVEEWLERLPVEEACGISEKIKWRLSILSIRTLADLGRADPLILRREFGIVGHYLHLIGQGKDPAPLGSLGSEWKRKSSHSRVLRWPYPDFEGAKETLKLLCAKVARRLRRKGLAGRLVHFYASSPDGDHAGRQRALGAPTADEAVIYRTCLVIAEELRETGRLPGELQGIGVSVGRLCSRDGLPLSLFEGERRRERLTAVMDTINDEWGEFSVYFGSLQPLRERANWTVASLALHREVETRRWS
jgi:DNA polymerase-4